MARRVFFSFHYDPDNWRAAKVRNMNAITDEEKLSDNKWETVRLGTDSAIKRWINGQIVGTSCTIVLIGSKTATRPWVDYEIRHSWEKSSQGIFGIYIHRLLDRDQNVASKGVDPFSRIEMSDGSMMSDWVDTYDPPYSSSGDVYSYISNNIRDWVERAVERR
jgi:hypothetical protein